MYDDLTLLIIILFLLIGYVLLYGHSQSTVSDNFNNTNNQTSATYNVQFVTPWGSDYSINHPDKPHTGNMFLITHNDQFQLFKVGELASMGISKTAMYGTIDELLDETYKNPEVGNITTGKVLMAPGQVTLKITATIDKPFMSFSTMIAPSSDWFTGFSNLNLMTDGEWINNIKIPLFVYIAGTDANQGFVTEHKLKEVPDFITVKNDMFMYPDGQTKPIAYAIISKLTNKN